MLDELRYALLRIKYSDVGEALTTMSPKIQTWAFIAALVTWQVVMIGLYGAWMRYEPAAEAEADDALWPYFRDVAVMIFFGFGLLMAFIRRFAFSAIGYTMVFSCLAVEWAVILGKIMQNGT